MKDLSGSDSIGVSVFYEKTNRFSARDFEDSLSKKFIDYDGIKPPYLKFHLKCPVCNISVDKSILAFTKDGYKHWCCKSCESLYTNPTIKEETIAKEVYGKTAYPFIDSVNSPIQLEFDKKRFSRALEILNENGMNFKGNGVLDFGSGSGFFLKICKNFGFEKLLGNDLLRSAISIANKKYDLSGVLLKDGLKDFNRITPEIGLVSLWEFLDHINEPYLFLEKLFKKISSGTYIIISVRNSDSLAAKFLQEKCNMFLGHAHFNFWSNKAVDKLIARSDLKLINRYQYISERDVVCNYLNYSPPYASSMNNSDLVPSSEEILKSKQGYKHVVIFQKS